MKMLGCEKMQPNATDLQQLKTITIASHWCANSFIVCTPFAD
jgi:hypothetical protein